MRILLFADIHIGSIKDITYVYNVMTNIIDEELIYKKTDLVVILGDYFHRLFKVNEEYVSLAINIMSYLIRACKKSKAKLRIVYGTESHEMNQYRLFNYHITSSNIDLKIFDTCTEETINGCNILYVPEEYIDDKHEFYKNTLYSNKKYDYIFGHGVIEDGMPRMVTVSNENNKNNEKHVPIFKSGELGSKCKLCIFGHYHKFVEMKNVYYLGSLFRDSFGEEEPKGYGIIEDDKFTFIENKEAYVFKTYEFDPTSDIYLSSQDIINEVKRIKEENKDLFEGEKSGKIRLVFKTPNNLDGTFKDNLKDILLEEKFIVPLIKENNHELSEELKDEIEDEYDFIIDSSLPITDKIFRYINKEYNNSILSMEELKRYLESFINKKEKIEGD